MAKITYPDKSRGDQFFGTEATEIKEVVNENVDLTEPSTWYVHSAPKGSNSNVGSDKFPFETIEYAVSVKEARDIIVIQNQGFFEDSDLTISTPLHIIGFSGQDIPELLGTWDVTAPIILQMVEFKGAITASSQIVIQISGTIFDPTSLPARHVSLEMEQSGIFKTNANTNLASLNGDDSRIIGSTKIQVGKLISLYKFSTDGGFEVGQDGSFTNTIKNVAISGDLTITGNLIKENSTVGGAETVSGSIDEVSQADDKLDRLSTSNQGVASNVAFEKQVRGGSSTVAFSSTKTFSMENGNFQKMPVTADITSLAIADDLNGHAYWIMLEIGGAGSYAIPEAGASFGTRTDNSVDDSVASWFPTTVGSKIIYTIARDPEGEKIYSIETITV